MSSYLVQNNEYVAENEAPQHLPCYWDTTFDLSCAFFDPYIDLFNNNVLHPQNYTCLFPYFSSPFQYDPLISDFIPCDDFDSYPLCPNKRLKLIEDDYSCCSGFVSDAFSDGAVAVNSGLPMPEVQSNKQQNTKMEGNVEKCKKVSEKGVSVSMQSIAARERRRKISEKTQELGKLVPGGTRMNTAEMLQAAYNYIKYLQAQLGILQLMDSFKESDEKVVACKEKMEIVTSAKVQEKLYMEEKCLVPKDVVLCLTANSKPPLSDQLGRLLP